MVVVNILVYECWTFFGNNVALSAGAEAIDCVADALTDHFEMFIQ